MIKANVSDPHEAVRHKKGRLFTGNLFKRPVKELNFLAHMQTCNYRHIS